MWKDAIEFISDVSKDENKNELMSLYCEYILSNNPFKRINNCLPCLITSDIIKIKNRIIKLKEDPSFNIESIFKAKYKSEYIKDKIHLCNSKKTGLEGLKQIVKESEKYIELAFILKSINKFHNYERLKSLVATLLAILATIATIKISIDI